MEKSILLVLNYSVKENNANPRSIGNGPKKRMAT